MCAPDRTEYLKLNGYSCKINYFDIQGVTEFLRFIWCHNISLAFNLG